MRTLALTVVAALALGDPAHAFEAPESALTDLAPEALRPAQAEPCVPIELGISFCDPADLWHSTGQPTNPALDAEYLFGESHAAHIIVTDLGTEDGLTVASAEAEILDSAQASQTAGGGDFALLEATDSEIDGRPARTLVFRLGWAGAPEIVLVTFWLDEHRAMQAATYAPHDRLTAYDRTIHESFVDRIRIGPDAP